MTAPTGGQDGEIRFGPWQISGRRPGPRVPEKLNAGLPASLLAASPGGDWLAAASQNDTDVEIWTPLSGGSSRRMPRLPYNIKKVVALPGGRQLLAFSGPGPIDVMDVYSATVLHSRNENLRVDRWTSLLAVDPTGQWVAVCGEKTIDVLSVDTLDDCAAPRCPRRDLAART